MNIRDEVVNALRRRFPDVQFDYPESPDVIATTHAPNPNIGVLEIHDDGDEVTVYVGELTHGHFNALDLSGADAAHAIVDDLMMFLGNLFADRVVIWKGSVMHGWDELAPDATPQPHGGAESHVWTHPLA
jgi:hypothetical protein